jgi:hypothetical protein
MFSVSADFICIFKIGDNINHNLQVLKLLYDYYKDGTEHQKRLLCKPIILILVSIVEAILHDFHARIKNLTGEGVKNLAVSTIIYIRGKRHDVLEKYIISARKHDLFDTNNAEFYDQMDELRKLRNRIHIQNEKDDYEQDEHRAFNEQRKILAEKVLEKVVKIMAGKHSRSGHVAGHVSDFQFPWQEHLSS